MSSAHCLTLASLGDGALTPAVSVLSAVEGLALNAPELHKWVVPITVVIIFCLFLGQQWGTSKIGTSSALFLSIKMSYCRKYVCSNHVPLVWFTVLNWHMAHSIESKYSQSIQSLSGYYLLDT